MLHVLLTFLILVSTIIDSLSNTLTHNPNQTSNFVLNQPNFTPVIHPYGHWISASQYNVSDLPHLRQSPRFLYDEFEVRDKIDHIAEQYKVVLEHLNVIPRFQRAALIRMSSRNLLLDGMEVWSCRKSCSNSVPQNPFLIQDLETEDESADNDHSSLSKSTRNDVRRPSSESNETLKIGETAQANNKTELNKPEKLRRNATQVNIEEIDRKELLQEEIIAQKFTELLKGSNFSLPDARKIYEKVKNRTSKITIPQIDLTLANELITNLSEELQNYLPTNDSLNLFDFRQLANTLLPNTNGASNKSSLENENNTTLSVLDQKVASSQVSTPTTLPLHFPTKPVRVDFDDLSPTEKASLLTISQQSAIKLEESEGKSENIKGEMKMQEKDGELCANTEVSREEEALNRQEELEAEKTVLTYIKKNLHLDSSVDLQVPEVSASSLTTGNFTVAEDKDDPSLIVDESEFLKVEKDSTPSTNESVVAEEKDSTPSTDESVVAEEKDLKDSTPSTDESVVEEKDLKDSTPSTDESVVAEEKDCMIPIPAAVNDNSAVAEENHSFLITDVAVLNNNTGETNVEVGADHQYEGMLPVTEEVIQGEERTEFANIGGNEVDLQPISNAANLEVYTFNDSMTSISLPDDIEAVAHTSEPVLSEEVNLSSETVPPKLSFPKLFDFGAVREFILDLSDELQENYAESDDQSDLFQPNSSSNANFDKGAKESLDESIYDKEETILARSDLNIDIIVTHEEMEEVTRQEIKEEDGRSETAENGAEEKMDVVFDLEEKAQIKEVAVQDLKTSEAAELSLELKNEVETSSKVGFPDNNESASSTGPAEKIPAVEPTSISTAFSYFTSEGFIGLGFIGGFLGAIVLIALWLSYQEYQKDVPKQFIERFEQLSSQYFQEKQYTTLIAFIASQLPKAIHYIGSEDHPVIYTVKHIMAKSQIILTSDIPAAIANLNALLDIYYLRYGEDTSVAELYEDRGIAYIKLASYSEALSSLHQALRIYSEEALSELYDGPANPAVRHLSDITIGTPQRRQLNRMKSSPYSERSGAKISGISLFSQEKKVKGDFGDFYGDNSNLTPLDDSKTETTTVVNTSYIDEYHAPDSDQKYYVQDMMESLHRQHRSATSTLNGGNADNSMDELTPTVKLHDSNMSNTTADPTNQASSSVNNDTTTHYAPYYRHSLEHEFSSQVDSLITLKELEDLIDSARLSHSPHYQYSLPHPPTYSSPRSSSPASATSSPFPSLPRPASTPNQDVLISMTKNYQNFFLHLPYFHDLLTAPNESILRVSKSLGDVYVQLEEYSHAMIFYCNTYALLVKLGYEETSEERLEVVEMIQRMKEILDVSFLAKFIKEKRKAQGISDETADTELKEAEEIHVPSLELESFIPISKEEIRLSTMSYYDSYHIQL